MQNIRRSTYKHRKILIVVVALLCVGLVGSFAMWNSDSSGGSQGEELTPAQQVESYEKYIRENEPADMSAVDYSEATSMASMYAQLSQLCVQAGSQVLSTDAAAAQRYSERSLETGAKAAAYYQIAIDAAPDTMNEAALAQLYANRADALYLAAEYDEARTLYQQALLKAPDNFNTVASYSAFIFNVDGFAAAETYLNEYMATQDSGSQNYANAEEQLKLFNFYRDVYGMTGGTAQ